MKRVKEVKFEVLREKKIDEEIWEVERQEKIVMSTKEKIERTKIGKYDNEAIQSKCETFS